ncbi:hypothetical protein BFW01_g1582 [Lasiodiplodia theobromae]|nr:hypothetical protein BFW01_g1582 [Lasiodiplodia theobromae]
MSADEITRVARRRRPAQTKRQQHDARMRKREREGFGANHSVRGDMADLNFDVVKHNPVDAKRTAMRVHEQPPDDETIALFTDASLKRAQVGGLGVVRVEPRNPAAQQGATPGAADDGGDKASKAYRLKVVTSSLFLARHRPSDCPIKVPVLDSEEVELMADLKAFKYACYEVEARKSRGLTTRRVWIFGDCLDGLDKVRLYKAGDSAWERHRYAYILRQILECARKLKELGVYVKCHWVPGHAGVPANECADYIAGKVAAGEKWTSQRVYRF